MKYLPLFALPLLAGCVSDQRVAELQASHRAYVCTHQAAVTLAANLAIENASKIKDENVRAAAVAIAQADLAIVAGCGNLASTE